MSLLRRLLGALLVAGLAVAGLLTVVAAATTTTAPPAKLAAVGPTDPVTGFPAGTGTPTASRRRRASTAPTRCAGWRRG